MAKAEQQEHESPIGAVLWNLPVLKSLRGIPEFKALWRGLRIVLLAAGLGFVDAQFFGFISPEMLTIISPIVEKELRERVALLDF